jgi:hypothetical protein
MHRKPLLTRIVALQVRVQERVAELRRNPDRGSHATEYAIGIGAAAAIVLGLFVAYQTGVDEIIESWVFQ